MEYQQLGNTGQEVSKLCLGTWQMGGDWGRNYDEAIAAVRVAYEVGVTFFDTAYAYGEGAAERALAEGLGDLIRSDRDQLVISTKGGVEFRSQPGTANQDAIPNSDSAFLRRTLEASLRHLGVGYVDVYFIHWPDTRVPFEETAETVNGFIDEGLVRFAGLSNFTVEQMEAFGSRGQIGTAQLPYNLLDRRSEVELFPYCEDRGIGVMGWSGLAHGLLSGTLRRGQVFGPDDWRSEHAAFQGKGFETVIDAVEGLTAVAADHGCSLPQLALAWIMANRAAVVPIVGAQLPEHIVDSAGAVDVELSDDDVCHIARVVEDVPPVRIGFSA